MSDKTRVKDLAAELNKQSKELLALIKELGIPAKTAGNLLTEDEIKKIRERLLPGSTREKGESVDVVVRRRRREPSPESPSPREEDAAGEGVALSAATDAPVDQETVKETPEAAPAAKTKDAPPAGKKEPRRGQPARTRVSAARIVSLPERELPPEKTEQAANVNTENDASQPQPSSAEERRPPLPDFYAVPETNAEGQPVSSAPHFAEAGTKNRGESGRQEGEAESRNRNRAPKTDRTDAPRREGGVRVISRPLAAQPSERSGEGERKTGRLSRPDRPDGRSGSVWPRDSREDRPALRNGATGRRRAPAGALPWRRRASPEHFARGRNTQQKTFRRQTHGGVRRGKTLPEHGRR